MQPLPRACKAKCRAAAGPSRRECRGRTDKRCGAHFPPPRVEAAEDAVQYLPAVHHPAEHHVFKRAAGEKIVQRVADVVEHHAPGGLRDAERVHVPAPVAIEKGAVGQAVAQGKPCRRLADAHRATEHVEPLHRSPSHRKYIKKRPARQAAH